MTFDFQHWLHKKVRQFNPIMSTQNDRAILNSIINPIQPVDEAELFTNIEDDRKEGKYFNNQRGLTLSGKGNTYISKKYF